MRERHASADFQKMPGFAWQHKQRLDFWGIVGTRRELPLHVEYSSNFADELLQVTMSPGIMDI